jgi:hypothetical protein
MSDVNISLPFRSPPATCEPVRSHVFPHEHYRRPSPSLHLSQQLHLQSELNPVISYSLVSEIRAHNFQRFELKRTYVSNGYAKSRTPHHSITSPPSPKSTLLPIQKNNVLCIPTPSLITLSFFFSSQKQQMFRLYLNLAVQRPMTSPWHTSSALNSEPSSVR